MQKAEWILCPICSNKTRLRIREDTILENFPLFCPKCKGETLVNVQQLNTSIIKEPDAKTQSRSLQEQTLLLVLNQPATT